MSETCIELYLNEKSSDFVSERTIICGGIPRGGTSMVAGAIHGLGVPMVDKDLPVNVEDPVFNPDYEIKKNKTFDKTHFLSQVKDRIQQRNEEYPIWGWKYPRVSRYLDDVISDIRNPCLVVVFRDPVPTAIRFAKRKNQEQASRDKEIENVIRSRAIMMDENFKMISRLRIPTLMVSYEKAIGASEIFLKELANFIDMPLPEDLSELTAFVQPGNYKKPPKMII